MISYMSVLNIITATPVMPVVLTIVGVGLLAGLAYFAYQKFFNQAPAPQEMPKTTRSEVVESAIQKGIREAAEIKARKAKLQDIQKEVSELAMVREARKEAFKGVAKDAADAANQKAIEKAYIQIASTRAKKPALLAELVETAVPREELAIVKASRKEAFKDVAKEAANGAYERAVRLGLFAKEAAQLAVRKAELKQIEQEVAEGRGLFEARKEVLKEISSDAAATANKRALKFAAKEASDKAALWALKPEFSKVAKAAAELANEKAKASDKAETARKLANRATAVEISVPQTDIEVMREKIGNGILPYYIYQSYAQKGEAQALRCLNMMQTLGVPMKKRLEVLEQSGVSHKKRKLYARHGVLSQAPVVRVAPVAPQVPVVAVAPAQLPGRDTYAEAVELEGLRHNAGTQTANF